MAVSLLEASRTNPSLESYFAKLGLFGLPHTAINDLAGQVINLRKLGLLDESKAAPQPLVEKSSESAHHPAAITQAAVESALVIEDIPYTASPAGKPLAETYQDSSSSPDNYSLNLGKSTLTLRTQSRSEFQRLMEGVASEGREQRPSVVLTEKQIKDIATAAVNEFRSGASVEILQLHVIVRKRVREFVQEHGLVPKAHDATITAAIYYAQYLYYS